MIAWFARRLLRPVLDVLLGLGSLLREINTGIELLRGELRQLREQPRLCGVNLLAEPLPIGGCAVWLQPGARSTVRIRIQRPIQAFEIEAWGGCVVEQAFAGTELLAVAAAGCFRHARVTHDICVGLELSCVLYLPSVGEELSWR